MSGVVHGGLRGDEARRLASLGIEPIDLSASLNPYGSHPAVIAAARQACVDRYGDPANRGLRHAWASHLDLPPEWVLPGNGSSELIYLTARAFLGRGECCVIAGPTFGEYAAAVRASGVEAVPVDAVVGDGFAPPVDALVAAIGSQRPALVVVCNPNNPTGRGLSPAGLARVADAARAAGAHLLVDEAYAEFAWPERVATPPREGVLVLQTLTKIHTIPGLRLGILLGTPEAIERVAAQQPPWAVGAPAAAAAHAALGLGGWAHECVERIATARAAFCAGLEAAGFAFVPPAANFVLVEVGDAAAFRARMLEHGVVVRDCSSFGLPGHVRVAVPRDDLVDHVLATMDGCR